MYSFLAIFAVLFLVQIYRKRFKSGLSFFIALVMSSIQMFMIEGIPFADMNPLIFYSAMFLIGFLWFCLLELFKLKPSAIIVGFLVVFQMMTVFNAVDGAVMGSLLYAAYPFAIVAANIFVVLAGFGERDDISSIGFGFRSDVQSNQKDGEVLE